MTGRFGFIGKRVAATIPLLLGVLFMVFLLLHITPGDPARTVAGRRATPEQLERVREELGLKRPFLSQYVRYVAGAVRGDLGTSIRRQAPVTRVIREGLPVSLLLIALGSILALVLAIPLAQWAARRRDRPPDQFVRAYSMVTLTVPSFWVGILLLVLVALPTGWFPVSGYGETFPEHARALVLPSLTLAIVLAPVLVRSLRAEFISVRESDYISMAKACGIGLRRLILRHELPNALIPAITLTAVSISYLLFGVVVVENTFSLPGLGQTLVNAVDDKDFPLVQGVTLVFALIVVAVYLIADILYTLIDPRIELR